VLFLLIMRLSPFAGVSIIGAISCNEACSSYTKTRWGNSTERGREREMVCLLLYAHRHRSILGAAGHIILIPANQLMVMVLIIWSLFNPGFEPATFQSLAQRAYQLR
jgi:hypothetical protein